MMQYCISILQSWNGHWSAEVSPSLGQPVALAKDHCCGGFSIAKNPSGPSSHWSRHRHGGTWRKFTRLQYINPITGWYPEISIDIISLWFIITGLWYTYPSEEYEFVSWDYDIPNCFWKGIKFHGSSHHQPVWVPMVFLWFPMEKILRAVSP